ncbi:DnaJ domain-containing protein [Arthrobacter sp. NPDC089319]|uniref:DnaJ domain-containing protein n=1 Tax=Arthrobacter sp. NPDC089319 TaxID=3155915 RepID=UPI00343C8C76
MNQTDLYAVLQVAPDASSEDIRRAYRALLRSHHPDLNPHSGGPAERDAEHDAETGAEERTTAAILHAYMVLGDAGRRADYDRHSSRRITARQNNEPGEFGEPEAAEPEASEPGKHGAAERTRPSAQRRPHPSPSVPSGPTVYLGFDDPIPPDAVRLGERPPSYSGDYRRWIVFDR